MMPSPSDSSRSLTSRPSTRGLTHLRLHRPWLQALLTLGLAQVLLGILVVTFSMVASSVTTTESVKRSCRLGWRFPGWLNLLFSVCGLTVCAAIICTLSAIVCCIQIFSLDLVEHGRGLVGRDLLESEFFPRRLTLSLILPASPTMAPWTAGAPVSY
uniref:Family with sequence similarity 189 member B n=1 Tax=Phocoena sinus TaxID=42100 RepID=A0A8C9B459_PHOSS